MAKQTSQHQRGRGKIAEIRHPLDLHECKTS
jgi:hypothetical protein